MNTLVITGIVKNEEEKVIETFKPFIDNGFDKILIVDTGSDDRTVSLLSNLSSNIKIGHTVFESFSHARNVALMMCRDEYPECKFCLMCDAEWYVKNLDDLVKFCQDNADTTADYFNVNIIDGDVLVQIPALINLQSQTKYTDMVHERPIGLCGGVVPKFFIYSNRTDYGATKTEVRNKSLDIPYYLGKERDNRDTFFLAQAYHNIKDYSNAILYYIELISDKDFSYVSHYRIGEIFFVMGQYEMALCQYIKASDEDSTRGEPYLRIAQLTEGVTKYNAAKHAYDLMSKIVSVPFFDISFSVYYRYLEMMKACLSMKKYKEGLEYYDAYCKEQKIRDEDINPEIFFYMKLLKRKIVILIMTSPGYEAYNLIMSKYLDNFDIEYYFYSYSEDVTEFTISGHQIYIPGKETFIPGILEKTIAVFRKFSDYDYIIRLNATTFIDLTKVKLGNESYKKYIDNTKSTTHHYYGYLTSKSLSVNEDYGVTETFIKENGSFPFVSGKCIILSNEAVNYFLSHSINRRVMDDVSIALSLKSQYPITFNQSFCNIETVKENPNSIMCICSSPIEMEKFTEMYNIN